MGRLKISLKKSFSQNYAHLFCVKKKNSQEFSDKENFSCFEENRLVEGKLALTSLILDFWACEHMIRFTHLKSTKIFSVKVGSQVNFKTHTLHQIFPQDWFTHLKVGHVIAVNFLFEPFKTISCQKALT